jgi:hypothetical protein
MNDNTPTHIGHRVFILMEARTYMNPRVPCVSLFFASVSNPTLKSCHKTMIAGAHHGPHKIKLHEINGVSIYS